MNFSIALCVVTNLYSFFFTLAHVSFADTIYCKTVLLIKLIHITKFPVDALYSNETLKREMGILGK